ncbi:MAG: hypothetical protein KZQ59_07220 [Candidatus Thiodiazotropha sp. (ex Lucinoma aequizonata)]|nr:hypothetical protein [Candidatus Thiodiazotropha sp. (ex Lucinoma aequizonata)]MCU7912681.1 hypothetical protein [Candidatus Thiodiazotropha sp. (ex Lucinoma aequizonata)]
MINADNGPENSGRRTQWLKRLTDAERHGKRSSRFWWTGMSQNLSRDRRHACAVLFNLISGLLHTFLTILLG